nr:unnamed protein product [Callosobruchus chinensis]
MEQIKKCAIFVDEEFKGFYSEILLWPTTTTSSDTQGYIKCKLSVADKRKQTKKLKELDPHTSYRIFSAEVIAGLYGETVVLNL